MPANQKYYCTECGWAAKSGCPVHPGSTLAMGTRWRPGRKGSRERIWSLRSSRNRRMPPAKRRYHVFYGIPSFIQELGVEVPKTSVEEDFYWSSGIGNPVLKDIKDRGIRQRQRRRRNRKESE